MPQDKYALVSVLGQTKRECDTPVRPVMGQGRNAAAPATVIGKVTQPLARTGWEGGKTAGPLA